MRGEAGSVERLAPGLWASHPAWSPDGKAIAFAGNSAPAVERLMEAQMDEPPPCPTDTPAARVVCYQYDALSRLTEAKDGQAGALTRFYQYAYDLRSNRTSAALDGIATQYAYDPVNRLTTILPGGQPSISLTYDLNGNLTYDGTLTYTYDAANRLRAVNDGTLEQLLDYDALGNRVRQTLTQPGQPTLTTDYLLDIRTELSQILRETTTGGPSTDDTWYMLGLDIIGQQQNGAWSYFGYDGLGSVRHLTDEYGTVTARMSYDPYGAPLQTNTASSLGFTGELTDPTGLVYLRARTYNPTLGIFTSRDPVLGVAGLSASYNGYGYVHGNPVNLTDASGEFAWLALLGVIVGAIYINDWRGQTYANQMQGMSFWDAVSYANNRPCPTCETLLSIAFPFLDTAFSARDFGYELSQGNIGVLSLLAMLPLLGKRSMKAADDLAAMARRGLRQGPDDLPSSLELPAEQRTLERILSNDFQVDETGRIRVPRDPELGDPGASLRRERVWPAPSAPQEFDIILYKQPAPGYEKHHGVLDIWAKNNIPGYRRRDAPAMVLSRERHQITVQWFREWRIESTGSLGGQVDWANMGAREAQWMSSEMFRAAGVPQSAIDAYLRAFNQYIYLLR